MDSKNDSRMFEDELFSDQDDVVHDEISSDEALPAYSSLSAEVLPLSLTYSNEKYQSIFLGDMGRFSIDLRAGNRTSSSLHAFSIPTQRPRIIKIPAKIPTSISPTHRPEELDTTANPNKTALNIVLMLVGCKGEIKSIILVSQALLKHGHRVRVVTHADFQSFVLKAGFESFSFSNDAQYPMARNDSGLIPGLGSSDKQKVFKSSKIALNLNHTKIAIRRQCHHRNASCSCSHTLCGTLVNPTSYNVYVSWYPTRRFAHPLAQIQGGSGFDLEAQNYISYLLVQESLGHKFTLRLPKLPLIEGAGFLWQFKIPHTYLWSPSLLPKPDDWDDFIDISGYITTDNGAP